MKHGFLASLLALAGCASSAPRTLTPAAGPVPKVTTIDRAVSPDRARAAVDAAGFFYAFWDTGDVTYADRALASSFVDHTLPRGRPQGPEGVKFASKGFRMAVPDLRCSIEDLMVVGNEVVARLVFTGTHTGPFMDKPPTGKAIRFNAIDILHVEQGKIVEDWHIEDNVELLRQLGAL
ncbi:ester cyclase [Pendulispora rubella]|uniref:Ester cyclase n=1 Tax=Pendulispora rubella TaxID=2741070 RepID=A0ABZ2L9T1_9BACT